MRTMTEETDFLRRLVADPEASLRAAGAPETALAAVVQARWPNGVRTCAACGSTRHGKELAGKKDAGKGRTKCKDCGHRTSPVSGTPLEREQDMAVVIQACVLAVQYRDRGLALALVREFGVPYEKAHRLATKVSPWAREAGFRAPMGRGGWSRWLKVAAVFALMTAALYGVLTESLRDPALLHESWTHGGQPRMLTTKRGDGEPRSVWHARHSEALGQMLSKYPRD